MTPLKVAVIGCGFFGSMHAEIYSNMNGVELAAVVDVSLSRAKELAAPEDMIFIGGSTYVVAEAL